MSDLVEIKWDFSHVERMLDEGQRAYERAAVFALNKAIRKARTAAKRDIATELDIRPQKLVNKRLRYEKATRGNYRAAVRVLTGPIPVIGLSGARDTRTAQRKAGRGVIATGGRAYKSAFIAQGRSRTRQVFQRKGAPRLPIEVVTVAIKPTAERALREQIYAANAYLAEILAAEVIRQLNNAR